MPPLLASSGTLAASQLHSANTQGGGGGGGGCGGGGGSDDGDWRSAVMTPLEVRWRVKERLSSLQMRSCSELEIRR